RHREVLPLRAGARASALRHVGSLRRSPLRKPAHVPSVGMVRGRAARRARRRRLFFGTIPRAEVSQAVARYARGGESVKIWMGYDERERVAFDMAQRMLRRYDLEA